MKQSRSKTNVPIGTKFEYRNVWLLCKVVVDFTGVCGKCYFYRRSCISIHCSNSDRTDGISCYFKQIPTPNE